MGLHTKAPRSLTCRPLDEDPASLVRRHLAEPRNGWSVGTYGALGEFEHAFDEPDLAWLVHKLEGPLFAVGFSLGASVLLNFLATKINTLSLGG